MRRRDPSALSTARGWGGHGERVDCSRMTRAFPAGWYHASTTRAGGGQADTRRPRRPQAVGKDHYLAGFRDSVGGGCLGATAANTASQYTDITSMSSLHSQGSMSPRRTWHAGQRPRQRRSERRLGGNVLHTQPRTLGYSAASLTVATQSDGVRIRVRRPTKPAERWAETSHLLASGQLPGF